MNAPNPAQAQIGPAFKEFVQNFDGLSYERVAASFPTFNETELNQLQAYDLFGVYAHLSGCLANPALTFRGASCADSVAQWHKRTGMLELDHTGAIRFMRRQQGILLVAMQCELGEIEFGRCQAFFANLSAQPPERPPMQM